MAQNFLKGLIPYPRKITKTDGTFKIDSDTKAIISAKCSKSFDFWLKKLGIEKIEKSDCVSPRIESTNPSTYYPADRIQHDSPCSEKTNSESYSILIGDASEILPPSSDSKEAYRLSVSSDGISICANDDMGLSYAIKTLVKIQLLENCIPALEIEDEPMINMRAIHMCLFDYKDGSEKDDTSPDAVVKRIELAALCGYNYLFLEFWGMFPYEKHPYACHPYTDYTKEKIEEIVNHCINNLHITPCPAQNLTSHAGWSRISTRRHVVLDQRPDLAGRYIPGGWCFATENPETKEFLRDVIDELAEAFHNPPMLHMCCDKAFGFGSTEEDRTKSADILFATHIANLNTYISSKGIRPVMWADMLYTSIDSLTFKTSPFVADTLSKNILMNIWTHNDPGEYWNDVDFFEQKGFQTVYSPFVNYSSIANMIKMCINKKSLGIVQTTWHKPEYAKPYFTYSIAKQWNFESDIDEKTVNDFLKLFDSVI